MNKGIASVLLAYIIWGLYPFYFHAMQHIAPAEIVTHRILWTFVLLAVYLLFTRRLSWIVKALKDKRTVFIFCLSSALITANWSTYTYSIVTNQTLEASLGYFMNPLVSVLLGAVFFKEKLAKAQKAAIGFALAGVLWVTFKQGEFPVLGITLALTFGFYGMVRKLAPLGSLEGLTLETAFAFPAAVIAAMYFASKSQLALINNGGWDAFWLVMAGPITTIPLLLFAWGLKKVPYSTVGFIQYLSPTMVFFIGLIFFGEQLQIDRLIGFMLIWTGVLIFISDSVYRSRLSARQAAAASS